MTVTLPEIPVGAAAHTKWATKREQRETNAPANPLEQPFQLDVVYVTALPQDANGFANYIRDSYAGFVRLEPIPNRGDGVSSAIVFHYTFPHATNSFMQGLYVFLNHPHSFLWLGIDGGEPRMYAGRQP